MTLAHSSSSETDDPHDLLFHAFPRRAAGSPDRESAQAILILKSILKRGLIITPEVVEWRSRATGQPTFTAQKRVCFTSIGPGEFDRHAMQFGSFAIGFDRATLESLGATPVFYVPRYLRDGQQGRNIGNFYIEKLLQIQLFLDNNPKSFSIGNEPVTTEELSHFTRFLTGLFYPVEDLEKDKSRLYFDQNEWRILGNLFLGKQALSRPLNDEEKSEISELDPDFFCRRIRLATNTYRTIDQSAIIDSVDGTPLRDAIRCMIAPARDKIAVNRILQEFGVDVPVTWTPET